MTVARAEPAPGLLASVLEWADAERDAPGPPWLVRAKQEAERALAERGMPRPKEEAWRFTPTRDLVRTSFTLDGEADVASVLPLLPDPDAVRVVIEGGAARIEGEAPDGVTVRSLADVLRNEPARIETHLGRLATSGSPFTLASTALLEDGLVAEVAPGAIPERVLHLVYVAATGGSPVAAFPRTLVLAGERSALRLVETFHGPDARTYLTVPVTELALAPGARVSHLRVAAGGDEGWHLGELAARLDRDAHYASTVVTLGGRLTRLDLSVRLEGEGAEARLDGLYLTGGKQLHDHHTFVDHRSPRATSTQHYKGVLDGEARAVFDGTVVVRQDAQKTNGSQENRNLLLSREALVHTKPHLAIDADDVKCSHGATVGQLDEDQLFYMRSRGIDADVARGILVYGFAREVLSGIADEAWRLHLGEALLRRLPHGERLRGLL